MKDRFQKLYDHIMSIYNVIIVEDINDVYESSKFLIYEKNFAFPIPHNLIAVVKRQVIEMIEQKQFDTDVKVNLKYALDDSSMKEFNDDGLYDDLMKLFEEKNDAFFRVNVVDEDFFWSGKYGEYNYPKEFKYDPFEMDTLHFSYPRIKPLIINKSIKNVIDEYYEKQKCIKEKYEKMQEALRLFKEKIMNFNDFGQIKIYYNALTMDSENVDMPTLDEAIEHECQHLCIFLLSLAKTCIWFGLHFSNDVEKSAMKYELKEGEFIALCGSYCNLLLRIYDKIDKPKSSVDFIEALLDLSIKDESRQNKKYVNALQSSAMFPRIRDFYRSIYKDGNLSFSERRYENGKFKYVPALKFNNDKFQKLVKWTLRNFEKNLEMRNEI